MKRESVTLRDMLSQMPCPCSRQTKPTAVPEPQGRSQEEECQEKELYDQGICPVADAAMHGGLRS
jgi:hypothetical protein